MSSDNTIKTLRDICRSPSKPFSHWLRSMSIVGELTTGMAACRRVQQDIEDVLEARGFQGRIQFNPKLKEQVKSTLLLVGRYPTHGRDTWIRDRTRPLQSRCCLVSSDPSTPMPNATPFEAPHRSGPRAAARHRLTAGPSSPRPARPGHTRRRRATRVSAWYPSRATRILGGRAVTCLLGGGWTGGV
jgi:hypothetical protein